MAAPRSGSALVELGRIVVTLALVVGATAGLLRALDTLPGYLQGEPRGVRSFGSIEEIERRLRERVRLPAYFPDTLRWPPAAIRLDSGPPPAVALTFVGREDGEERLVIVQSFGPTALASPRLLAPGRPLQTTSVPVGEAEARVVRILGPDGLVWHDVSWRARDRQLTLRSRGSLEELLRMARSTGP